MRKSLAIIIVVAVLGVMAVLFRPNSSSNTTGSSPLKTTASQTTSTTPTAGTNQAVQTSSPTYKDGNYSSSDSNRYESVTVQITIQNGQLTAVDANANARDFQSQTYIDYGLPQLKQQTLAAKSANIDGVSGATMLSQSYQTSLQAALNQAANG